MKKFMILLFSLSLLAGCGKNQSEESVESNQNEVPKMIEVTINITPEKIEPKEKATIQAHVTQGEENVDDAEEMEFEIGMEGQEETQKIPSVSEGNGVYSIEKEFKDEGVYYVIAHVTARGMHTMPKQTFVVGDAILEDEKVEKENHDHMGHGDAHHGHGMDHSDMVMEGSAEVPENLKVAENPKFPVGSKAISLADHMGGMMDDVEVTIVGAFETTAYATTYTSTTNGQLVEDHKWIVHEEFVDVGEGVLEPGTKVSTTAEHMHGMKDAVQTIDFYEKNTVYMVDFVTPQGQVVKNHKWVTEGELKPLQ